MLRVDTYELHRQCGTWDTVFAGTDEVPLTLLGNEDGVVEPPRGRADWGNSGTVTSGLPDEHDSCMAAGSPRVVAYNEAAPAIASTSSENHAPPSFVFKRHEESLQRDVSRMGVSSGRCRTDVTPVQADDHVPAGRRAELDARSIAFPAFDYELPSQIDGESDENRGQQNAIIPASIAGKHAASPFVPDVPPQPPAYYPKLGSYETPCPPSKRVRLGGDSVGPEYWRGPQVLHEAQSTEEDWKNDASPALLECLHAADALAASRRRGTELKETKAASTEFTSGLGTLIHSAASKLCEAKSVLEEEPETPDAAARAHAAPAAFTTGSGAPLHVSARRLAAARKLLDEDSATSGAAGSLIAPARHAFPPSAVPALPVFTTGLGRPVTIRAERLAAARELLQEYDQGEGVVPSPDAPAAFTTGLGAPVEIDSARLVEARRLLDGDAVEDGAAADEASLGAQTGRGRPAQVGAGRLTAAWQLLEDAWDNEPVAPRAAHALPAFTTGLGAPVEIPTAKLAAAKRLLDDGGEVASLPAPPLVLLPGFTTGLGTPVAIPAAKLAAAKRMLDSEGETISLRTPPPVSLPGFTTGLGASASIDRARLKQAKALLQDEAALQDASAGTPPRGASSLATPAPTFTTGLGQPVAVDARRLAGAKALLEDDCSPDQSAGWTSFKPPLLAPQTLPRSPRTPQLARPAACPSPAPPFSITPARPLSRPSSTPRGRRRPFQTPRSVQTSRLGQAPRTEQPGAKANEEAALPRICPEATRRLREALRKPSLLRQLCECGELEGRPASGGATAEANLSLLQRVSQDSRAVLAVGGEVFGAGAASGSCDTPASPLSSPLPETALLAPSSLRPLLLRAGADARWASEEWAANAWRWALFKAARVGEVWRRRGDAARLSALGSGLAAVAADQATRRYAREFLEEGRRGPLQAILQHDEAAEQPMVLLVASVDAAAGAAPPQDKPFSLDSPALVVELTDGRYWVRASLDGPLAALARSGRLRTGCKLRVAGASLQSSGPGEPLEAANSATLRLAYNGTRPAAGAAALGRASCPGLRGLWAISPEGGPVPRLLCVVRRALPAQTWAETGDGRRAVYERRAWAALQRRAEESLARAGEEAEARLAREERDAWEEAARGADADAGERAFARAMLAGEGGVGEGREMLALAAAREAQAGRRREELVQESLQGRAEAVVRSCPVLPLLLGVVGPRGRLRGEAVPFLKAQTLAACTVWRPSEELLGVKEGSVWLVTGLVPRWNPSEQMLELQTAKHSLWTCIAAQPSALPPLLIASYAPWATLTVRQLAAPGLHVRDADAVGVLVGVGEVQPEGPSNSWQWVFLTDASCWDASSPPIPRLLAVRRGGSALGTDWFDPGVRPGACSVRFQGLAPEGVDERGDCVVARLRRAGTGELLDAGDLRGRGLEAWAKQHPACLEQCADTVRRLLGE